MIFDFATYMNTIATEHKQIAQTADYKKMKRVASIADIESVCQDLNDLNGFFLMAHINKDGNLGDFTGTDNFISNPIYPFYVMKKIEFGNIQELEDCFNDCLQIGNDILSKLIKDSASDKRGETENGLKFFNNRTFKYYSVGPFGSYYRGIRFQFELTECKSFVYDPNKWK